MSSFPNSVVQSHKSRQQSESYLSSHRSLDKYSAAKATSTAAKKEAMRCIEARDKSMEEAAAATRALEKNRAKQVN